MAEVTGRIGDNEVALENAATEATLKALLLAMSGSTKNMDKLLNLANKAGLDPKSVEAANKGADAFSKAAFGAGKVASVAMSGLAKGAMVLGGVIGDLTASTFKTVGNLTDFAGKLLEGTASVSGLFGALKDLPLGIGIVAGLFEKLASIQEANLAAFREISKVGINLGGDLDQVRLQALEVGLTMSEYGEVLKNNAATISLMGTSVDEGAKAFRAVNKVLTTGGLSKELLSLGFSFKDINELTANYIKVNGGLTESQKKDSNKLAQSVANYGKELDVLSRLTGKSREQLEKEQEAQTQDANFQSYLNGLDADERDKANAALRLAMESGGKGAADALKAKLLGLPPLTEEAQMYMATMQNGGKSIEEFSKIVKNGKTLQESQLELDKAFGSAVAGNIKDLKQFETVMRAGGMTGEKMATTLMSVQETINKYKQKGLTDEEAIQKAMADERKKQIDQTKSAAASAAESERALKALGAELMGAMIPIFKALTPIVNDLAKKFMEFATNNMPAIEQAMGKLAVFVSNFAKDIFSDAGQAKIINDIVYYFKLMLIEVKKAIVPFYNDKDAAKDTARLEIEKAAMDKKAETARTEMEIAAKQAQLTNEKKKLSEDEQKKIKDEIAALEKTKAAQKEAADKAAKKDEKVKEGDKTVSGLGGAAAGAATLGTAGALLGSVIPIVGTAIGGAIGAALGGVAGGLGLIDYGVKEGLTDEDVKKSEKKDLPQAAFGGLFSGPKSGYPVMLHGEEAVVPMGGLGKKSPLESLLSKLPGIDEIGNTLKGAAKDPEGAMTSFAKTLEQFGQKVTETAKPAAQDAAVGLKGMLGDVGLGDEKLVKELQTLNKQTAQMLNYMKESVDIDRKNLDAVRGLNGNLFA
jgi:hypothetical protein